MTRNEVQYFSVIKCVEASEVTLTTHLTHPFIVAWIQLYLRSLSEKTLSNLPTGENVTLRYFARDFVSFIQVTTVLTS